VDKFNSEGYYDPVPYEALSRIEREQKKWRPLVYICSPYSAKEDENTIKARRYSRYAVDRGAIPLAPHLLLPQFMSDRTERDLALFMGMVLLGKCEQLWVFGSEVTDGMTAEISNAKKRQMTILYFTDECEPTTEGI
jgi:hypothetical protein